MQRTGQEVRLVRKVPVRVGEAVAFDGQAVVVDAQGVVIRGLWQVGLGDGVDARCKRGVWDWSVGDKEGDGCGDGGWVGGVEVRRVCAEAGTAVRP